MSRAIENHGRRYSIMAQLPIVRTPSASPRTKKRSRKNRYGGPDTTAGQFIKPLLAA